MWNILHWIKGYEIEGLEKIPDQGPAVLILYHGICKGWIIYDWIIYD